MRHTEESFPIVQLLVIAGLLFALLALGKGEIATAIAIGVFHLAVIGLVTIFDR